MQIDPSDTNVVPCVGKKVKELPSAEWLNERFLYEEDTGRLVWKTRPREHFLTDQSWKCWNTKYAGTEAGAKHSHRGGIPSKINVRIGDGKGNYLAHRIIFALKGVEIPDGIQIDHRNGNPWDNRWDNLRLATHGENTSNRLYKRKGDSNLPKGVYVSGTRFSAAIRSNKKLSWLGTFNTSQEAEAAYISAASTLHKEFARTGCK
jgi:hypothetical protein